MQQLWLSVVERVSRGANAANLAFLILLVAVLVAPLLARLAHLPSLVALVLLGMAVGPHGFAVLSTQEIALSALGELGLLYLMFTAGLELDLNQLRQNKRATMTFAVLSFSIPFGLGMFSAYALGYTWAAAVLMGSNWGSHTLATYPILRQLGLARSRSVSIVVGATMFTDTTALLVLAAVSVSTRRSASFLVEGAEVLIGLTILATWSFSALPRLAHRFFARVGTESAQRLAFALVALFVGAILAEAAGIDGIVGAFFAGLGLGKVIPEESPLMDRIQFLGTSLLIPIFLISVGVLLDPLAMLKAKTLLYALVFSVVVLGGKSLAALLVGRPAGLNLTEIGVMSGLSGSQAAATLATTLVGARLGLFDAITINAVLMVILVSLIVTPAIANACGRKLAVGYAPRSGLGHKVFVPLWDWNESTHALLPLAERLAEPDNGMVVCEALALESASEAELATQRSLRDKAEQWLAKRGLEGKALLRITSSPGVGMIKTVCAEGGSLILSEWAPRGQPLDRDQEVERQLERSPVPLLLVRAPLQENFRRVVIAPRAHESSLAAGTDLHLALEVSRRIMPSQAPWVLGIGRADATHKLFASRLPYQTVLAPDPVHWLERNLKASDLLLFPGLGAFHEALSRLPALSRRACLVVLAGETVEPYQEIQASPPGSLRYPSSSRLRDHDAPPGHYTRQKVSTVGLELPQGDEPVLSQERSPIRQEP